MSKKLKNIEQLTHVDTQSTNIYTPNSKEPFDGEFIQYESKDSFSSDGVVRYGEEQDVDDL